MEMEFETVYREVEGVVKKARRDYYIKAWEKGDWHQEGMLKLHELLVKHPELAQSEKLRTYFKVKFTNYVKDMVRKQESQKRRFDRMGYEEISEIGYTIQSPGLLLDEMVVLRESLVRYKSQLTPEELELYQRLVRGEVFRGRSQAIKKLRAHLKDFEG